jgi:DNA-binding LacI/PurR family transcriptional regulator
LPGRWHHGTFSVTVQRLHGLTEALQLRRPGAELVVEERFDNTIDSGADAFEALLDRHPDLTAVCCLSDQLALGALRAAARRGLAVPADITITGYDGIPEAARVGLTTVAQPLVEKGRTAGELFLTSAGAGEPRRRMLPTRLEVRATSGPPARR